MRLKKFRGGGDAFRNVVRVSTSSDVDTTAQVENAVFADETSLVSHPLVIVDEIPQVLNSVEIVEQIPQISIPVEIDSEMNVDINNHSNSQANIASRPQQNSFENLFDQKSQLKFNEKVTSTEVISKLYLRLGSKHLNSEKSMQDISNSLNSAGKCSREEFGSSLNEFITDPILKQKIIKSFDDSLRGITDSNEKNVGIFSSSYRQQNFFRENPKYVKPIQVPLLDSSGKDTGDFSSYVPLLKTLQVMLQNKNIREYCSKAPEFHNLKGFFDIIDGFVFKNNKFFHNSNRLRLVLFQDAFNPCEAIGPAKNLHKLIGVYLMLFNLPPHLRSKTENIKLVLLCYEKHVKEYGWGEVLKTLVADLLHLESEGIDVFVSEEIFKFWGSIATICGDNLGSNDLGGFIRKFNAGCCCRQCERSVQDFRANIFAAKPLRTVASYNENLEQARELGKSVKGIQSDCPFNVLSHYHTSLPGLPGCLGHDVFEGFAKEDMHVGIFYFIDVKKWFTLKLFNTRLKNLNLPNMPKINIPEIKRKEKKDKCGKLTGVAYQVRHLILILPILMADKIQDVTDPVWRMLLTLREIVNLLCAPALSQGQVGIKQLNRTLLTTSSRTFS